jgi:hypothetical protein
VFDDVVVDDRCYGWFVRLFFWLLFGCRYDQRIHIIAHRTSSSYDACLTFFDEWMAQRALKRAMARLHLETSVNNELIVRDQPNNQYYYEVNKLGPTTYLPLARVQRTIIMVCS